MLLQVIRRLRVTAEVMQNSNHIHRRWHWLGEQRLLLKRQLKKIGELRQLQMDGMELDANQEEVVKAEPTLRQALDALEKGEQRCFDCAGEGKIGKGKRQKKCSACGGTGVIKFAQDSAAAETVPSPVRLTKKQLRQKQKAEREAAAKAKLEKQDFNNAKRMIQEQKTKVDTIQQQISDLSSESTGELSSEEEGRLNNALEKEKGLLDKWQKELVRQISYLRGKKYEEI